MERDFVAHLIGRFNEEGVRYLIAGGFAVNAHGYMRYTNDLDIILWTSSIWRPSVTKDELAFDREVAAQINWDIPLDEQELEQLRHFARLSLWEKLGWLEEAQRYVEGMKASRAARGLTSIDL